MDYHQGCLESVQTLSGPDDGVGVPFRGLLEIHVIWLALYMRAHSLHHPNSKASVDVMGFTSAIGVDSGDATIAAPIPTAKCCSCSSITVLQKSRHAASTLSTRFARPPLLVSTERQEGHLVSTVAQLNSLDLRSSMWLSHT